VFFRVGTSRNAINRMNAHVWSSCTNLQQPLRRLQGGVFHMQRIANVASGLAVQGRYQGFSHLGRPQTWILGLYAATTLYSTPLKAQEIQCIDYYTVGQNTCATPQPSPQADASAPRLLAPQATGTDEDKVDEFLENYGKPPREFVAFYLNPTAENAQKWVAAYQQIMQKTQNLSQLWSSAEQLYQQDTSQPVVRRQDEPLAQPQQVVPVQPVAPVVRASSNLNFGGLGAGVSAGPGGVRAPVSAPLTVTYYYSQACPFCARMTPELNVITANYSGKLAFTCVDVTPVTATQRPDPAYLSGKLPCQWRLPQPGELEEQGVKQTPTLLVQREGASAVRLSGYMSQAQLQPFFR